MVFYETLFWTNLTCEGQMAGNTTDCNVTFHLPPIRIETC